MHHKYSRPFYSAQDSLAAAQHYRDELDLRRSVRHFSDLPVDRAVIEAILATASSAPSGAHKQPWTFCAVSNAELKSRIRVAAEEEEYAGYHGRMGAEWLADLQPIGTDWHKPFLEIAPWLIIVFKQAYGFDAAGQRTKHYYVTESVGIACGFLLAAVHAAGLVALTHTPSPMNFLSEILERPDNERPYLLIPVGYPAVDAEVPSLRRKSLAEMAVFY